jgi:replicative DNA helicase
MPRPPDISPLSLLLSRVDEAMDLGAAPDAVATGFASLDRMLSGGLRRGELTVLGGDVGSGKSALALGMALRAAPAQPTLLFTGEMPAERVHERAVCIEGRVNLSSVRAGQLDHGERAALGLAALRLQDRLPLLEPLGVEGVARLGQVIAGTEGLGLVVVDGLQSLVSGALPLAEELATAVRELKALALALNVAILATAQLADGAARADRRPTLDDLGALGAVKHHADVVLVLYREEQYSSSPGITGATELLVRKNRHGGTGYVDLYFHAPWLRFEDMLDPDPPGAA